MHPGVVLGIAAHPDDLDFGAAGTLAYFASQGAKVYYLILTDGSNGTADPAVSVQSLITSRQEEQRAANSAIGGAGVDFLTYPDGALEVTMQLKHDIAAAIRTYKPDIVITMDPSMVYAAEEGFINHPDHRAAGQATLDAVYPLARDHLAFPDLLEQGMQPHQTTSVLLINLNEHNYVVDISECFDKKISAITAHTSQMGDSADVIDMITVSSQNIGKADGFKYAEGFVRIDIR